MLSNSALWLSDFVNPVYNEMNWTTQLPLLIFLIALMLITLS